MPELRNEPPMRALPPASRESLYAQGNTYPKGSSRREYDVFTPEFKESVLLHYVEHGGASAARAFRLPLVTVLNWAKTHEVPTETSPDAPRLAAAEARTRGAALRREEFRVELLEAAQEILTIIREVAAAARPSDPDSPAAEFEIPPALNPRVAQAAREWTSALAILVDRLRLESGEVTSRTATVAEDARENLRQKLDELARRRELKAAAADEE